MLSQPRTSSIGVTAVNGGQKVDLTTVVTKTAKVNIVPSILTVIRNTSVSEAELQGMGVIDFRLAVVAEGESMIEYDTDGNASYKSGKSLSEIKAKKTQLISSRVEAASWGAKYEINEWDDSDNDINSSFAMTITSWTQVRAIDKEKDMFELATNQAQAVSNGIVSGGKVMINKREYDFGTADAKALSFRTGAHVEEITVDYSKTDGELGSQAYNHLTGGLLAATTFGMARAMSAYNKRHPHFIGIQELDLVILTSTEFELRLKGKEGLVFSAQGYLENYKQFGITSFMGIPLKVVNTLPQGVDFIITTQGTSGALAYAQRGKGISIKVKEDPENFHGRRADLLDQYSLGIVIPEVIWVGKSKSA